MRKISIYFILFLSLITNLVFIYLNISRRIEENVLEKQLLFKNIAFEDGLATLIENSKDIKELNFNNKISVIYVLDTLDFIFKHYRNMKTFDSLAYKYGKSSFNYLFISDYDDAVIKEFLKRKGFNSTNFNVIGGMDNFISGVYNQNKSKDKKIRFFGDTSNLDKSKFEKFKRLKIKPAYFIMDKSKNILDFQNKNINILNDTVLRNMFNDNFLKTNTITN